jgi:hypothetical protein
LPRFPADPPLERADDPPLERTDEPPLERGVPAEEPERVADTLLGALRTDNVEARGALLNGEIVRPAETWLGALRTVVAGARETGAARYDPLRPDDR